MMLFFGLIGLVSCHLAGSTEAQAAPFISHFSKCQWDNEHSLICSFAGIIDLPSHGIEHYFRSKMLLFKPIIPLRTVKHIDLSNNEMLTFHGSIFCNFSSLETLNLSTNFIHDVSLDANHSLDGNDKTEAKSLPELRTLLLDRNRLRSVPQGIGNLRSLQTLSVSYNRIIRISQNDFANCTELKTIELGENRICEIHPDAFRYTRKLQVLSLRGNALTTITPMVFIFSHVLHANHDLSDNPWVCDCRMRDLKHVLSFVSMALSRDWGFICSSPPSTKGKHLLSMEDFTSTCERSADSTNPTRIPIKAGKPTLLPCDVNRTSNDKVSWWTPQGPIFEKLQDPSRYMDNRKSLILTVTSRADEGLYLCVSEVTQQRITYEVHFHVEDQSTRRSPRNVGVETTQVWSQQDFTLAVCLSVIITFICAFCLGVFVRPFLDLLWKKRLKKKTKKEDQAAVYENEGFTDGSHRRDSTNVSKINQSIAVEMYETDSSSGSYAIIHEGRQGVILTQTAAAVTSSLGTKTGMERDMDIESELTEQMYDSDIDGIRHERSGTYSVKDKTDQNSDNTPTNDSLPESEINTENPSDPNAIYAEIVKSPKRKQLFLGSNSHDIPHAVSKSEDETDHATDRLHNKNVDSTQNKHIDNSRTSNTGSDEGSDFSFSLSNSLSDASEAIEVMDVNENAGGRMEMVLKASQSSGDIDSLSQSDLGTSPDPRRETLTISPVQNKKTQESMNANDMVSTSQSDEEFSKRDLHKRASSNDESSNLEGALNYTQEDLSPNSPTVTSNDNKTVSLVPRRRSETISTDQSVCGTSRSTSEKQEHLGVPGITERHQYKKMQNNDIKTDDPDPYKAEAVLRWLQTTTNDHLESLATDHSDRSSEEDSSDINSQGKEEKDLPNLNSQEWKENVMERNPSESTMNLSAKAEHATINLTNGTMISSIIRKMVFDDEHFFIPQEPAEKNVNRSRLEDSSSSSEEEHGGAHPGITEKHRYNKTPSSGVANTNADPYKAEAVSRWLQTTTNDHTTSHASQLRDVTSVEEDSSDVNKEERKEIGLPDFNRMQGSQENVTDPRSPENKLVQNNMRSYRMAEPTPTNLPMNNDKSHPVTSSNNKAAFNHQEHLKSWKLPKSNSKQSASDTSQRSSDDDENGGTLPGIAERHQYKEIQYNDAATTNADPYNADAVDYQWQSSTNNHATYCATDPRDRTSSEEFSDISSQEKYLLDLNPHETNDENVMDYNSHKIKAEPTTMNYSEI
uniref:Ig-like domain-containing protein n=1 Tax=Leptobrachium leishanense TaxID=445787 RepID=A0A8C5MD60_9ANUR